MTNVGNLLLYAFISVVIVQMVLDPKNITGILLNVGIFIVIYVSIECFKPTEQFIDLGIKRKLDELAKKKITKPIQKPIMKPVSKPFVPSAFSFLTKLVDNAKVAAAQASKTVQAAALGNPIAKAKAPTAVKHAIATKQTATVAVNLAKQGVPPQKVANVIASKAIKKAEQAQVMIKQAKHIEQVATGKKLGGALPMPQSGEGAPKPVKMDTSVKATVAKQDKDLKKEDTAILKQAAGDFTNDSQRYLITDSKYWTTETSPLRGICSIGMCDVQPVDISGSGRYLRIDKYLDYESPHKESKGSKFLKK